jgi:hypothetical protein
MCRPGLSAKIQKLSPARQATFANELQMAVAEARVRSWGMMRRRQSLSATPMREQPKCKTKFDGMPNHHNMTMQLFPVNIFYGLLSGTLHVA